MSDWPSSDSLAEAEQAMGLWRAIRAAIWDCDLDPTCKLVAVRMVEHLPNIEMSVSGCAEKTGLSERSVREAIRRLETYRVIITMPAPGRRSKYEFVNQPTPAAGAGVETEPTSAPRQLAPPTPAAGAGVTPAAGAPEADPEKRTRKAVAPARRWRQVPKDWSPTAKDLADARAALGSRLETELAKFRDHDFGTPRTRPDATWRNWVRTAVERGNAPRGALAPRGGPERADNGWRPDQRQRTLLEGILASLSKRGIDHPPWTIDRLAGDFIRSGALGALTGGQADKAFADFIREKVGR